MRRLAGLDEEPSRRAFPHPARQADREFGEFIDPAVDFDCTAVLLGDDVIADRQAEPGAFACWTSECLEGIAVVPLTLLDLRMPRRIAVVPLTLRHLGMPRRVTAVPLFDDLLSTLTNQPASLPYQRRFLPLKEWGWRSGPYSKRKPEGSIRLATGRSAPVCLRAGPVVIDLPRREAIAAELTGRNGREGGTRTRDLLYPKQVALLL